jgi:hypothetical protein
MEQGRREQRMGVLTVEGALAEARLGPIHYDGGPVATRPPEEKHR